MIYIAEDIATQYNLCLYCPAQGISKPIFEKKYRDGFLIPKTNWVKRVKNTCKLWAFKGRDFMKRQVERDLDDKEPLFAQKDLQLYKLHARYIFMAA